jgi:hypothetical protein
VASLASSLLLSPTSPLPSDMLPSDEELMGDEEYFSMSEPEDGGAGDTEAKMRTGLHVRGRQVNSTTHVTPDAYRRDFSTYQFSVDFNCPYLNLPLKALNPLNRLRAGFV